MKCPYCDKVVLQKDKCNPAFLLLHIKRTLKEYKKHVESYHRYHDHKNPDNWLLPTINQWQAWHDWVEKKLEQPKANRTKQELEKLVEQQVAKILELEKENEHLTYRCRIQSVHSCRRVIP